MAYYLALDGGGTKTRCVLADEKVVLARTMTGGSNLVRLGETHTKEVLRNAVYDACASARVSPAQIKAICIGAAGAARPEIADRIRAIFAELIPELSPANLEVVGDTVIALEAAFGTRPGVIAIAGTGSIAYGRDQAGHVARAGGWGFAVSDEGSGHWIGRCAISAILRAHDNGRETALTSNIFQAWKIGTIDELVQVANATPPPDFPRLFPMVLRASDEGDVDARELLAKAGAKLADLTTTVIDRLSPPNSTLATRHFLPVAMTGSAFRQSASIRQIFYNTLQKSFPGIEVRQGLVDPVEGALARARQK
jgi:N-acetylglucosamine kinase-like BadF-type ATPase